jgi:hypothetical protein
MEARDAWGYLIVWEFRPKPGMESKFEEIYGSHGAWAEFFRRGSLHPEARSQALEARSEPTRSTPPRSLPCASSVREWHHLATCLHEELHSFAR